MIDALGVPRSLLVLGGNSEIGLAIATAAARLSPGLSVTLAARPGHKRDAAAARLSALDCVVDVVDFEATDHAGTTRVLEAIDHDVDLAVVAFGLLGDSERAWTEVEHAVELATVNYVGAVSAGVALAERFRRQGHGTVVALSSVAGERPRRSNFVYGSTKAGLDAFYTGLGEALRPQGGRVLVVRPGFVHSAMTRGLEPAPLATTPAAVADAVLDAIRDGREQIWVPRPLRGVMSGLRHLPRGVFRRLPI